MPNTRDDRFTHPRPAGVAADRCRLFFAGRLNSVARRLLRAAVIFAAIGVAGLGVRWVRPLRIVAMVDVSPSTRGAAFRDEQAIRTRLTPLLAGRAFSIQYFADGPVISPGEVAADRTRLPAPPDADAVLLFSDGRLAVDGVLPATFPIVEPSLDRPGDARVTAIQGTSDGHAVMVDVVGQAVRPLWVDAGVPRKIEGIVGPRRVAVDLPTPTRHIAAAFDAGDLWPENDALRMVCVTPEAQRLAVGLNLPGFRSIDASMLGDGGEDLADASIVVLPTDAVVSPGGRVALDAYVRSFGGTLVLVGPPGGAMAAWSPLSAFAPAGPGRWVVLLDASGSMATANGQTSRWQSAVNAATAAVERLPGDARVSVGAFSDGVRMLANDATPADARRALAAAAATPPRGPTGLRAAIEAVAKASPRESTRLLLLTDGDAELGDVDQLADALKRANVRADALVSTPADALTRLCEKTGGQSTRPATVDRWATAFGGLVDTPDEAVRTPAVGVGRGAWAGRRIDVGLRWRAWVKGRAETLLDVDAKPVAAAWRVGLGRVTAVSASVSAGNWANALRRLESAPADPHFAVDWDETVGRVRLTARDVAGPMNGLKPTLWRGDSAVPMAIVAPGIYEAALDRRQRPSVGVVLMEDRVISRQALAGRYAEEFDAVGNDRPALQAIADRTGGRVIDAGDNRPIQFAERYESFSLQPLATVLAAGCAVAAALFLRRR
ncbi:MAG: vWA domain-containing protein [Tepidisphaeraceae bacterium]